VTQREDVVSPSFVTGAWNWRRAVNSSDLSSTTKHTLLVLACYTSEAGEGCFPSLATLASDTSLNRQTVKKHLRLAESKGWIRKEGRFRESGKQTSNIYRLTAPMGGVSKLQGGAQDTRRGGAEDTPPGGCGGYPPVTLKGTEGKGQEKEEVSSGKDLWGNSSPDSENGKIPTKVIQIFEYWRDRREAVVGRNGGPRMVPTKGRIEKIGARFKEGYTEEQLKEAVDGCFSSDFNIEKGHTDIELICRNQGKVEYYRTQRIGSGKHWAEDL